MIELLLQVAFTMQKEGKFAGTVTIDWLNTQLPGMSQDDLLQIARNTKLIDYSPEKIGFSHQILQEYFAALALKKDWQEGKELESYFTDYRWDDTVLVCAGLIKETEKFIKEIWSPGKISPDAFLLAMKAVGISGRFHISDEYYEGLIQEAKAYLGLSGRTVIIGYSPTVLAVDTVKALSYIDDDQTAGLLNTTLIKFEGWLRELSIQTLGSSRNPVAHALLRTTLINQIPYGDLFLAAPYFSRREWLTILARSVFSFKRFPDYILSALTGKIKVLFNLLQSLSGVILICLLFLILDLLLNNVQIFGINLYILSGRLLSIIILLLLLRYHSDELIKVVRSKESTKAKLKLVRSELTWVDLLFLVPIILLWFYPTGTLLLLEILAIYVWLFVYYLAVITRRKIPASVVSLIYYNSIWAIMIFIIIMLWGLIPWIQKLTLDNQSFRNNLNVIPPLRESILLLVTPFAYHVCQILISLIIAVSIVVFIVTRINYWRLQRFRMAYINKNNIEEALKIKAIAINPSAWLHVREKAFKELRLIDLPFSYIEDFESLVKVEFYYDIQREFERTVYELQARVREKDREGATLLKRQIRILANQGKKLRDNEHYEEALAAFNQAITLVEKNTELIVERGITYAQMKHYEKALTEFNLSLSINPKEIDALEMRGETYRQMERFRDAFKNYSHAISLYKEYIPAYIERGITYRYLGKYHDALADFNRVLAINEKNISALGNKCITLTLMERYEEALAGLDSIIARDSNDSYTLVFRGQLKRETGHYQEALTDFDHAITIDEKNGWAKTKRGETYLLTGNYPEALSDFNRAIDLDGNNSWYRYDRALVFMIIGNKSDSESELHAAIELAHNHLKSASIDWGVRLNIALYTLAAGSILEAEAQFSQLALVCPFCSFLQDTVNDLKNFLRIQPSNEATEHICAQLEDRIIQLKRLPIQ